MTAVELKESIGGIISDEHFGIEMFAVLNVDSHFQIKKFQMNDTLSKTVKEKISTTLKNDVLCDDFNLTPIQNIEEKAKTFYEIIQDDTYAPFNFLNMNLDKLETYKEKEQKQLKGFCIKINRNNDWFWVYQHKYPMTLINRDTFIFAIFNGFVYKPLDYDVIKLEQKADVIILGKSLISKNLSLLQTVFGFENYVRSFAAKTIETIKSIDIISDMSKLIDMSNKPKLTTAKKLMKAFASPVLKIPRDILLVRIKEHSYFKEHIAIDAESNKIVVSSQKSVKEFLEMLNDAILYSQLTELSYESSVKEEIKNVE